MLVKSSDLHRVVPVEDAVSKPTDETAANWKRKLHRWCREGRIVNAVKIGRRWFVTTAHLSADAERDAVAELLRSRGFAA